MAFSLYAATVPSYLQTLGAVAGLLDKAESFCTEKSLAPSELIQSRLAADMLPFAYQVKSTAVHSLGAIEALRRGLFAPDMTPPPGEFATLRSRITTAISALEQIDESEIEGLAGRDVRFSFGERHINFTGENFLLSFSLPNFYFHAATTYDILRWKGVALGKRDFMGRVRSKK